MGRSHVDDIDKHPWLIDIKMTVKELLDAGKPTVGLCLGSQIIAQCLGATVKKNAHWEVGWFPVEFLDSQRVGSASEERSASPSINMFHYHQDMFDLPVGAQHLARSAATPVQAFSFGAHVFATQFHPEASDDWIRECAEEAGELLEQVQRPEPYLQDIQTIISRLHYRVPMQEWFFVQLDRILLKR